MFKCASKAQLGGGLRFDQGKRSRELERDSRFLVRLEMSWSGTSGSVERWNLSETGAGARSGRSSNGRQRQSDRFTSPMAFQEGGGAEGPRDAL
ncbi:hypothetical protein POX_a01727 [Penicillium oxalicum]|uniref:hypothetical protein n=1 Tax=Penicillium oxalicum TaxID=69781 RepID=UPI0020B78905|nr:hypothetical protein POX_a01727 [Penicillium oxalicum]KAI2795122.1 hypothetical protein POX_a01727 [Penicillium oxalicum]